MKKKVNSIMNLIEILRIIKTIDSKFETRHLHNNLCYKVREFISKKIQKIIILLILIIITIIIILINRQVIFKQRSRI